RHAADRLLLVGNAPRAPAAADVRAGRMVGAASPVDHTGPRGTFMVLNGACAQAVTGSVGNGVCGCTDPQGAGRGRCGGHPCPVDSVSARRETIRRRLMEAT